MKKRGPPGYPALRDTQAARAPDVTLGREPYFWVTALLATPPPADFTQTVVGLKVVVARKAQLPALSGVVAMRAPVHAPPTAGPSWISTLAAKLPLASRVVVPSARNSPVPTTSSARLIVTESVAPAGGGAGAAAFTTCVTVAEVLVRKSRLPR